MKKSGWWCSVFLLTALVVVMITGCGGSDDSGGPSVNVTGTWIAKPSSGGSSTLKLAQNDSGVVSGTVDGRPLSGSVDGNNIGLTGTVATDSILTLSGTVNGNTMSGDFQLTFPGGSESGTWTATKS